jgi:hypothetical protein
MKNLNKMKAKLSIIICGLIFIFHPQIIFSQVLLEANEPGNTYELINSVLAPGYDAVENPECVHPEFGRHISEVWDADLKQYVFEFNIHVLPDNDRCINFDRQRLEIKTYDSSPNNLKGVSGETITYKWKFKIPVGFQPSSSFTHLHQIKAVGGNDDMPIFTFTARKASPNKLEIIHNNETKLATINLSLLEGNWVEATETIKVDSIHGSYSLTIRNIASGATILAYSNADLMTIRSDNSFIRPKWGIYRSLLNSQDLRDESVRFNSFSILEHSITSNSSIISDNISDLKISNQSIKKKVQIEYSLYKNSWVIIDLCNLNGETLKIIAQKEVQNSGRKKIAIDVSTIQRGVYILRLNCNNNYRSTKLIIN